MKRKKILALLLAGSMVLSLAACGSSGDSSDSSDSGSSSGEGITLLNGKPEISEQLDALAAKYEEETGNKVTINTIGGDVNASDELKNLKAAGELPDIFVIEANQAADWEGMLADLSGEQWTEDTDFELTDDEMGTIGFPYTVEATALAYNAEILEKAGVDPASLTSPEAYKTAFETIDAKKDELGITAVIGWCAEASNLGWSSGTHVFGQYLDAGLAQDDTTYIDLLNDGGKIDDDRMLAYAEFIGLMNEYSDPSLLVDGTYDDQVGNFAKGQYAFVTQGSWIGTSVVGNDNYTGWSMGFAPYAFEDGIDTIIAGAPSYWTVYSDGNVDGAKEFLQWVSDDSAQDILVNEANLISPFNDCSYAATDPFYESIKGYMDAGKTSGWHTMLKKTDLQNVTSVVYQDYAKGNLDAQGFVDTMKQVIEAYYAE